MAITTYTELQTAVGNWLGRSDLTSRIPEFISLAEPKLRRVLLDTVTRSTGSLTIGVSTLALPTGAKRVISFAFDSTSFKYPLRRVSADQLATLATSGSGRPTAFAVINGTLYFDITPDAAYSYILVVFGGHTALSVSPTNSILTNSPDLYLYGALLEAAPYLEHDERVALWSQAFEKAVNEENIYRERAEYAGATEQDLPVVFGGEDGT